MTRLRQTFFENHVVEVAQGLLGKILVFQQYQGIITETEAYRGTDDEASHAFKGPTNRARIMFGSPGVSYVYLIYGMYHCLNIVTEPLGQPSAVLIRGLKLLSPSSVLLDGPGKICRTLGINLIHNGIDITTNDILYVLNNDTTSLTINQQFIATKRIGINKATDKLWRFTITADHVYPKP